MCARLAGTARLAITDLPAEGAAPPSGLAAILALPPGSGLRIPASADPHD